MKIFEQVENCRTNVQLRDERQSADKILTKKKSNG